MEYDLIREYLWKLIDCDMAKLPVEMVASWTTIESQTQQKYRRCLLNGLKDATIIARNSSISAPVEMLCQQKLLDGCPTYVGQSMSRKCHLFMESARSLQLYGSQVSSLWIGIIFIVLHTNIHINSSRSH